MDRGSYEHTVPEVVRQLSRLNLERLIEAAEPTEKTDDCDDDDREEDPHHSHP